MNTTERIDVDLRTEPSFICRIIISSTSLSHKHFIVAFLSWCPSSFLLRSGLQVLWQISGRGTGPPGVGESFCTHIRKRYRTYNPLFIYSYMYKQSDLACFPGSDYEKFWVDKKKIKLHLENRFCSFSVHQYHWPFPHLSTNSKRLRKCMRGSHIPAWNVLILVLVRCCSKIVGFRTLLISL